MADEVIVLEDSSSSSEGDERVEHRRQAPERPRAPGANARRAAGAHSRSYGAAVQTALAMAAALRTSGESIPGAAGGRAKGKAPRKAQAKKPARAASSSSKRLAGPSDRSSGTTKREKGRRGGVEYDADTSRGRTSGREGGRSRGSDASGGRSKERKQREAVGQKRRRDRASSSSSSSDGSPLSLAHRLELKRLPPTATAHRRPQSTVRRRALSPEVVEISSSPPSSSSSSGSDSSLSSDGRRTSQGHHVHHHIKKRRRLSGSLSSSESPLTGFKPQGTVTASRKTAKATPIATPEQQQKQQQREGRALKDEKRAAPDKRERPSTQERTGASSREAKRSEALRRAFALSGSHVRVESGKSRKAMAKSIPKPSTTTSSTPAATSAKVLRPALERERPPSTSKAPRVGAEGDAESSAKKYVFCRKSGSADPIPPRRPPSPSTPRPPPPRPSALPRPRQQRTRSLSPPSSPEITILSRNRRVSSSSGFNPDNVALEDVQAQEREMAYIQATRKQARAHTAKTTKPRAKSASKQQQQQQHSGEVIEIDGDHSDASSEGEVESPSLHSEPPKRDDDERMEVPNRHEPKPQNIVSKKKENKPTTIVHPTAFRALYVDDAPVNLLNAGDASVNGLAFMLTGDRPLTYYDDSNTLEKQCAYLPNFGEPKQLLSSSYPQQPASTQEETSRSVQSVADEFLPVIRGCQQAKVRAVIAEARQRTLAYNEALEGFREDLLDQDVSTRRLSSATTERRLARKTLRDASTDPRSCAFEIGRDGEGQRLEREMRLLAHIRPVSRWTTSIGTKSSVRVEDDPILRHSSAAGPGDLGVSTGEQQTTETSANEQVQPIAADRYGLRVGSAADEEVVEYVLRLVVARLGDSDQVFHALKTELGLAQAYTDYLEHKKQHERRVASAARWDQLRSAVQDAQFPFRSEMEALLQGMSSVTLDPRGRHAKPRPFGDERRSVVASKQRAWRPHPDRVVESNLLSNWATESGSRNKVTGLRVSGDFGELAERFTDAFCRLCFTYDCQEHGSQHPLPLRRVDPAFPTLRLPPSLHDPSRLSVSVAGEHWRDTVAKATAADSNGVTERTDAVEDPTEYIDKSHAQLVMSRMRALVATDVACSSECWKSAPSPSSLGEDGDTAAGGSTSSTTTTTDDMSELGVSDVAVLNKLRSVVGDAPCVLAALVGCVPCASVYKYLQREGSSAASADARRSGEMSRRSRSWRRGRALAGGARHQELLRRTRNERLRDRGCANHEYKPCSHDGPCNSMACSCMTRDHMCEKACACPRDCPNRFEGCACAPGTCHASGSCPCVAALRECDPDRCLSCGASEIAVVAATRGRRRPLSRRATCCNVNVQRGAHKRLRMGFSAIHGWGVFAAEPIACGEFVYEYTGALLSQDEAERRGFIYDHNERSYLFDLNEDAVVDAMRNGNKSKFVNHKSPEQNCRAKVLNVGGVHHIGIWAERDVAVGEELSFDYGYSGGAAPDWSQRRVAS